MLYHSASPIVILSNTIQRVKFNPGNNYLSDNSRTRPEICLKLATATPERQVFEVETKA